MHPLNSPVCCNCSTHIELCGERFIISKVAAEFEVCMSGSTQLVQWALEVSGSISLYEERKRRYSHLPVFGDLPTSLDDIVDPTSPWGCHSLAFRMATYGPRCEAYFERWDSLLAAAKSAGGWSSELTRWNASGGHWARDWKRFHEFLWLLQVFEYWSKISESASFVESNDAAPDLAVRLADGTQMFVECYFYSKWWINESFLDDVLRLVDCDFYVRRRHNLARSSGRNPLSAERFEDTVNLISASLAPRLLVEARKKAKEKWPQVLVEVDGLSILLRGEGEYQPDPENANGDPAGSWPVFFKELADAKEGKNGLDRHRANIIAVNCLGLDFQLAFKQSSAAKFRSKTIDEIWVACCGIDSALEDCQIYKVISAEDIPNK